MADREETFLVYDGNRERAVESFIEMEFQNIRYIGKQIPIGDYHICKKRGKHPPVVKVAIERKTPQDYAAGFKDGRYGNWDKLLELRKRTGCQLYLFIEGPAFPSPNRKFARIPYSNILASITLLMVRHGIMVIQTEDAAHTAKRLHDLCLAVDSEKEIYQYPCEAISAGSAASAGSASAGDTDVDDAAVTGQQEEKLTIPTAITTPVVESDDKLVIKMWARLRGVSVVLGSVLLKSFSVTALVRQTVPIETINTMKSATGRLINKDARQNLLAVRLAKNEQCVKVLSGIKGVSPAMAQHLIKSAGGFSRLCSYTPAALSIMRIPQKSREIKLGELKANRIHKLLNHVVEKEVIISTQTSATTDEIPNETPVREYSTATEDDVAAFLSEI